jgi:hypothetical protein
MADIKTIKVKAVEFQDQYQPEGKSFTIFYFQLETEEGELARFSTNGRNQTKFLVGNEYEVVVSQKGNRSGINTFFDYSDAFKEAHKGSSGGSTTGGQKKGGAWQPYVRPRSEIMSIIAQSSYEAAVLASVKIAKDKITSHEQVKVIAEMFTKFITDTSGLNSPECKTAVADKLKEANQKSIVYQAGLKRAIDMLDLPNVAKDYLSTQGLITLTELIVKDINEIANGL